MSARHFHRTRRDFSAKNAIDAAADAIIAVKGDDLTDADLGRVLCKSADRVREYRLGLAEMKLCTFLRGTQEWGPDFADGPLSLAGYRLESINPPDETSDPAKIARLAGIVAKLAEMSGRQWSKEDLQANREAINDLSIVAQELSARLGEAD